MEREQMEPVGENEAPSLLPKDSSGGLTADGSLSGVVVKIGQPHTRRDSRLLTKREGPGSMYGASRGSYATAGGGAGGRRWSESSNHSSMTYSRRISAVGTIFESPHISVGTQLVLVAPAFLYAIAVVMWLSQDQDIEFARELAPVSFAALCVHLFAAGEIPYLTFWEVVHYWFHAACEVLVANDYTRKIGGGVWGVFLTSVLMFVFWPTGWVMLRRLRVKLNHPSRTCRFPNVGESAMNSGVPLVCLSLYLGTQSLSCLVYEGVTDCALKNSGTRHLNYSLGTLYVMWMLFRHLTGSNAKQVMLFRLRAHQSYAVVFSFLSTMYSLYEYAAKGIPYRNNTSELMADLVIFLCWFLSIVTIINAAPREHTPAIMYLSTVIPDTTLQIESLEVAPDGAFTENDRKRLSLGPLSRDHGPLGRMLRETGRPLSNRGAVPEEGSPRGTGLFTHQGSMLERTGSLHGSTGGGGGGGLSASTPRSALDDNDRTAAEQMSKRALGFNSERTDRRGTGAGVASLFNKSGPADEAVGLGRLSASGGHRSAENLNPYEDDTGGRGETSLADEAGEAAGGDAEGDGPADPNEYTHPILKYYRMHKRIPPLSFINTYLCEIVFFWRFMLFIFTVGYKLFLSLAAYYIMNRHWAQIFTPLSTSALTVSWLLTLGCDPRDRVSNQMMNVHFWFHALSEIPDILVWMKNGETIEAVFNILILVIVWPWVYIAYRRVLTNLRAKYRGQEEDTSVKLFWEGSFLMAVEFYLAFQANGCLVHAPVGQESTCDNIIHSNMISGMNIILIFLVVRVILFKMGDLTITRTLHLELRPYEILVVIFSVVSGLVSLYFMANREDGVTEIGEIRQGLEWITMFLWILVCLLMAHLTPTVGSVRAKALEAMVSQSGGGAGGDATTPNMPSTVNPPGLDEAASNLTLAMAAERRKGSRATGLTNSPPRGSPLRLSGRKASTSTPPHTNNPDGEAAAAAGAATTNSNGTSSTTPTTLSISGSGRGKNGDGAGAAAAAAAAAGGAASEMMRVSTPTRDGDGVMVDAEDWVAVEEDDDDKDAGSRCCCACWDSFAFWMDQRNTQNNLPVFRLLYFSSTVVYFAVMLGVAAGGIKRGYATAVVGVSFASVCSHWLISIEHPTSTMEAVHLLLHALTEAISVLLWVSVRDWTQAVYTLSAFFAVYPCLFYGIQALKLGLHRKFSDHLALVREAMKIFLRSSVLLLVLMYLAFECIGCLNSRPEADCAALLYANTQVGLSVVLGFLSFLGLIVMQDITARHFLQLSFTWPQVAVLTFSLTAVGLCIFSLASRHFSKLTTDIWEHMVELATLFSWYAALLVLWIRRPWYDTSWGENDSMSLNEADEEEEGGDEEEEWDGDGETDTLEDAAAAAGGAAGKAPPEWAQVPTHEMGGKSANLV